jgi:hypothetical protein
LQKEPETQGTINIKLEPDTSSGGYFGAYVLDSFGAPKLSELKHCNVPKLDLAGSSIASIILNGIFVVAYSEKLKRLLVVHARRVEQAAEEYIAARKLLLSYLERLPHGNSHFLTALKALSHFEQCLSATVLAHLLHLRIRNNFLGDCVKMGDFDIKTKEKRISELNTRIKHHDQKILGLYLDNPEITAPVWLSNEGLHSPYEENPEKEILVKYDELHEKLQELMDTLKFFAEELPKTQRDAASRQAEKVQRSE